MKIFLLIYIASVWCINSGTSLTLRAIPQPLKVYFKKIDLIKNLPEYIPNNYLQLTKHRRTSPIVSKSNALYLMNELSYGDLSFAFDVKFQSFSDGPLLVIRLQTFVRPYRRSYIKLLLKDNALVFVIKSTSSKKNFIHRIPFSSSRLARPRSRAPAPWRHLIVFYNHAKRRVEMKNCQSGEVSIKSVPYYRGALMPLWRRVPMRKPRWGVWIAKINRRNKTPKFFTGRIQTLSAYFGNSSFIRAELCNLDAFQRIHSEIRSLTSQFNDVVYQMKGLQRSAAANQVRLDTLVSQVSELQRMNHEFTTARHACITSNGTIAKLGDIWQESAECQKCACKTVGSVCQPIICQQISCNPKLERFVNSSSSNCCPFCKPLKFKDCLSYGHFVKHGAHKTINCRYRMRCNNGAISLHAFSPICPRLRCSRRYQMRHAKSCCRTCEYNPCVRRKPCGERRRCIYQPQSRRKFRCECRSGFVKLATASSSSSCSDVNECRMKTRPHACDPVSTLCVNEPGSYRCECRLGFTNTDNKQRFNCTAQCPRGHCLNGGICVGPRQCRCQFGFQGDRCEKDIDECVLGVDQCQRAKSTCQNLPGSYQCVCKTGYRHKFSTNMPPASSTSSKSPANGNATVWAEMARGASCKDVDECEEGRHGIDFTCATRASCVNLPGDYRCKNESSCYWAVTDDLIDKSNHLDVISGYEPIKCRHCTCQHGKIRCAKRRKQSTTHQGVEDGSGGGQEEMESDEKCEWGDSDDDTRNCADPRGDNSGKSAHTHATSRATLRDGHHFIWNCKSCLCKNKRVVCKKLDCISARATGASGGIPSSPLIEWKRLPGHCCPSLILRPANSANRLTTLPPEIRRHLACPQFDAHLFTRIYAAAPTTPASLREYSGNVTALRSLFSDVTQSSRLARLIRVATGGEDSGEQHSCVLSAGRKNGRVERVRAFDERNIRSGAACMRCVCLNGRFCCYRSPNATSCASEKSSISQS